MEKVEGLVPCLLELQNRSFSSGDGIGLEKSTLHCLSRAILAPEQN